MFVKCGIAVAAILSFLAVPTVAHAAQFKHIVVIVQENRTPDNLFGSNPTFEPGVDIATSGTNSLGQTIPLGPVALNNCYDLGHSHGAFLKMYNNGLMNGADQVGVVPSVGCVPPPNAQFRYVDNSKGQVQPYFDLAKQYGFANRMFQTNQGPSFPAHQFLFGGTSAPSATSSLFMSENMTQRNTAAGCLAPLGTTVALIDSSGSETSNAQIYPCVDRPTLSDQMNAAGINWRYYTPGPNGIWNAPNAIRHICVPTDPSLGQPRCTGSDWSAHVQTDQTQILADIQTCNLPSVSWVMPSAPQSDHAQVNDGTGPSWVASIVNAIGTQATCPNGDNYWKSTAIFITWDDWGGWYDHVAPFRIGQTNGWGTGYTYGFRVPLLVVSAYTVAGTVVDTTLDFGSILRFIEANFALKLIGPGNYADAYAKSLAAFFNVARPRAFQPIATKVTAAQFLANKPVVAAPDNE